MKYPDKLKKEVQTRSRGMHLEGINEGAGPLNPKLMIVGEAPGRDELKSHRPFSGNSGKELTRSLASIGLTRDDVYITSAVRSRPYSIKKAFSKRDNAEVTKYPNRKPTKREILAHAPFLDYEIKHVNANIIVAVGNTALERLIGKKYKISEIHGKAIEDTPILELNKEKDGYQWSKQRYILIAEYHPAAVFYNRKIANTLAKDWAVIKQYLI